MDDSHLTKRILNYDLIFGQNGTRSCWSTEVKEIFSRNNLGRSFSSFPFNLKVTIDMLSQSLLLKDQTRWKNDCSTMPKLRTYITFQDFFCDKAFINKPLTFIQRKFLAKLRLGILPLRLETARYQRPTRPEHERVCLICGNLNEIENESHFLLSCKAYTGLRNALLNQIEDSDFPLWDDPKKLRYLTCDPTIVKSTAQFIISAFDIRSTMI